MLSYDDVIKWKHFPRYRPFLRGIHRSPVNSPHKGQWRGALMFSLICVWINVWVNNGEAADLRCHRPHYNVIIMIFILITVSQWVTFCMKGCTYSYIMPTSYYISKHMWNIMNKGVLISSNHKKKYTLYVYHLISPWFWIDLPSKSPGDWMTFSMLFRRSCGTTVVPFCSLGWWQTISSTFTIYGLRGGFA